MTRLKKVTNKMLLSSSVKLALSAVEFGYKACEKGWNLQKTLAEARKTLID